MLKKIRLLSVPQKIGQLFFIGLPGIEIDKTTQQLLQKVQAGGICLFSRNIRTAVQTRELLDELRHSLPVPPILSLDQEGGLVDRLRRLLSPMPAVSSLGSLEATIELAQITAQAIRILGFNTNFAPVVDIPTAESLNSQNGLQSRVFGNSSEAVVSFSSVYLQTLQKQGILGCLKHFPGIGASQSDPHEELPIVNLNRDNLFARDLVPYQKLLSETHSIMLAHAAYPNFDLQERDQNGKLLPSSLSFKMVTQLLRQEIGFDGLIVTDDLEMGAILKNYGIGEACKMALQAGADMLLICANREAIEAGYEAVLEAFLKGEIAEARLDESLQRIARYKDLLQSPLPFDPNRLAELSIQIEQLKVRLKN